MIFNRTAEDVVEAKRIRAEKVQSFSELTEDEKQVLERGFVTLNTIIRIEEKQIELKNIFFKMGYYNAEIVNKVWEDTDIFNETDFLRIIKNSTILRKAFFEFSSTPDEPKPKYTYETLNSLERILFDLDEMITAIKGFYKECGSAECGGNG